MKRRTFLQWLGIRPLKSGRKSTPTYLPSVAVNGDHYDMPDVANQFLDELSGYGYEAILIVHELDPIQGAASHTVCYRGSPYLMTGLCNIGATEMKRILEKYITCDAGLEDEED